MSTVNLENHCKHCIPSCEEMELSRVFIFYDDVPMEESQIVIKMQQLPYMRYHRTLVKTNLELVVSVGGLAGLFFGASLLSIVEAIYIIFIRTNPKSK